MEVTHRRRWQTPKTAEKESARNECRKCSLPVLCVACVASLVAVGYREDPVVSAIPTRDRGSRSHSHVAVLRDVANSYFIPQTADLRDLCEADLAVFWNFVEPGPP